MRRTTLAALAATSLLLAGLAGCGGGDPEPKIAKSAPPSPSVTVSSSPTPTAPTPPVMPAAAKKHTVAGAKAFTRFFISVVNYSSVALDSTSLQSISSSYCDGCNDAIKTVKRLATRNAQVVGGSWAAETISVTPLRAGQKSLMRVTTMGKVSRQTITYPSHKQDLYRGGSSKDRLILLPTSAGWMVDTWDVLS